MTNPVRTEIPVTWVSTILPYTRLLHSLGAPVERMLNRAKIPADLLNYPSAVVPLQNAFMFGELACQTEGTEHLGFLVGLSNSLEDYGSYGKILQDALSIYDYLQKGISLYNMVITGQRLRLSQHGEDFRLTIESNVEPGIGAYQSHMETLITTIAILREAAGPDWSPRMVSLAYKAHEKIPDTELLAGTRIVWGSGQTYLTIPRSVMGLCFPVDGRMRSRDRTLSLERSLHEDLASVVKIQIESFLSERAMQIDTIAESLAMNTRSLQRNLAKQGATYSLLLSETRIRKAAMWLENSDKPIAEIATDLGYSDASNFTRAFRQHVGVSPQLFRHNLRKA